MKLKFFCHPDQKVYQAPIGTGGKHHIRITQFEESEQCYVAHLKYSNKDHTRGSFQTIEKEVANIRKARALARAHADAIAAKYNLA